MRTQQRTILPADRASIPQQSPRGYAAPVARQSASPTHCHAPFVFDNNAATVITQQVTLRSQSIATIGFANLPHTLYATSMSLSIRHATHICFAHTPTVAVRQHRQLPASAIRRRRYDGQRHQHCLRLYAGCHYQRGAIAFARQTQQQVRRYCCYRFQCS